MGGTQSTQNMAMDDILKFLEEEVGKWGSSIANLKQSWKQNEGWVPAHVRQQIEETETRWFNIKPLVDKAEGKDVRIKYPKKQLASCCEEVQRRTQDELNQLRKNNDTLLQNKGKVEKELMRLKQTATRQQHKAQYTPPKPAVDGKGKSDHRGLKHTSQRAEHYQTLSHDEFVVRILDLEEKLENEKAKWQTEKEELPAQKIGPEKRVELQEKSNSDLMARNKEGIDKTNRRDTENEKQQANGTPQHSQQVTDKESQTEADIEETMDKAKDELEEKYQNEKSKNEELIKENKRLNECNKRLEEDMSEVSARNKIASEQNAKGETERREQNDKDTSKKQTQQVKTTYEKPTGRDNPTELLRKKCQQMEKSNQEILEQADLLKAQNESLQTYVNQLKDEKDEVLIRLSKIAGDKLVDNNPAITDLSDPNRPTKLGEFYSEIYDNEWTNAFEALVNDGYDDVKAIETLRLTIQNIMQFCERKSELLLQKVSDAVNLLFEEYKQMEMRMPSHLTMPKQQAKVVGALLRREQSSLQDITLQRRWEPNIDKNAEGVKTSPEKAKKEDHSKLNADTKLKKLQKDMASLMVPIVQKAYIEASWTNRCIEDLKPYILKCLYLGWMMVVQSPPLVLHAFPDETEIKFDKNLYREYTASGPLVNYVVWPALLLEENGPVILKGVAEGKKPKV